MKLMQFSVAKFINAFEDKERISSIHNINNFILIKSKIVSTIETHNFLAITNLSPFELNITF